MSTARGSSIFGGASSASKFAPDRFRGTIMAQLGMASASRWQVEWPKINGMVFPVQGSTSDFSNSEDKNLLCAAAQIPGKTVSVGYREMGGERVPYATGQDFPQAQFTYYLTNSYEMRHYFQEWMNAVMHQPLKPSSTKHTFAGYHSNYVKDVKVTQYTRDGRRVYDVKLIDAFPVSLSTIDLNSQLQTAAHEFTVSMAYTNYSNDATRG
jgi:hypothetical protein